MKLSVLVPIYNMAQYLEQCLESLHKQTLMDMEILCLNDGSTDDSENIIDEYLLKDNRFKKISKKNTGYGNTMNIGIDAAEGKYLAIVESDDFIEPNMMDTLVDLIETTHVDVVKSDFNSYSGAEKERPENNFKKLPTEEIIDPINNKWIFLVTQSIWSAVYSMEFLKKNNIRFNETPGASFQDVAFAFKVFASTDKIYLTNNSYYHYRTFNPEASMKKLNKADLLCGEIDSIFDYIACSNKTNELLPVASRLAFRILFEHYWISHPGYQFVLLDRLDKYLIDAKNRGDFKDKIWDDEALENALKILRDKNDYYKKTGRKIFDGRLWDGTINATIYAEATLNKLKTYNQIILYGAGVAGRKIEEVLVNNGIDKEKLLFSITTGNSDNSIDGVPIINIDNIKPNDNQVVLIAVSEQNQYEIKTTVVERGFKNVIYLSDEVRFALYKI